jgi:hypothetical protein
MLSIKPPGGNGTTKRMGRVGQVCDQAAVLAQSALSATKAAAMNG